MRNNLEAGLARYESAVAILSVWNTAVDDDGSSATGLFADYLAADAESPDDLLHNALGIAAGLLVAAGRLLAELERVSNDSAEEVLDRLRHAACRDRVR